MKVLVIGMYAYLFICLFICLFIWLLRRAKSGVKVCHFVMVDFNKDINIIKHNFLKRFCNVGLSGTVLHVASGSSSACAKYARKYARPKKLYF